MTTIKTYLRIKPENSDEPLPYTIKSKASKKCFLLHGRKSPSKHVFEEIFDQQIDQKEMYEHFSQYMLEAAFSGVIS